MFEPPVRRLTGGTETTEEGLGERGHLIFVNQFLIDKRYHTLRVAFKLVINIFANLAFLRALRVLSAL